VKPLPADLIHATLPRPGEEHLEYWGPVTTTYNRTQYDGYLVLTNQRISFVAASRTLTPIFFTPLEVIYQLSQSKRSRSVVLHVNELEFVLKKSSADGWPGDVSEVIASISTARQRQLHAIAGSASSPAQATPQNSVSTIVREREIIREVVRLPCRFCGGLVDQTVVKCPNCGAVLRS
jgi:hypothetical protein